jgi:hypothetical protein
MKKYVMSILCFISSLSSMEMPNEQLSTQITCTWDPEIDYLPEVTVHRHFLSNHSFHNATVFNWNGYQHIHKHVAQTATTVHLPHDIQLPEYDLVVAPRLLEYEDGLNLRSDLFKIRDYVKTGGTFLGMIQTQTNGISIHRFSLINLYGQIYDAMAPKKRDKLDVNQTILSDDEAKKNISEIGYDIISYTHKNYNILITNKPEFKCRLRNFFAEVLTCLKITGSKNYALRNRLVTQSIRQLTKNDNQELIYPYNITEVELCKLDDSKLVLHELSYICDGKRKYFKEFDGCQKRSVY